VKDQEGSECGIERGLMETKAGSVERAAGPTYVPGEDAQAQIQKIQIQDLAEISRSSKGALLPLTRRRPGSDIRCPR
jgi:hypothetical protein